MENKDGYNKRPLWQWILIYVVAGAIVYGLIYYFVLGRKISYQAPSSQNPTIQSPTGFGESSSPLGY